VAWLLAEGWLRFTEFAQFFGVDPFLPPVLYTVDYLGGIVRPPGRWDTRFIFSTYLVPVVIISVWSVWNETESGWKRMHAVTAALARSRILLSGPEVQRSPLRLQCSCWRHSGLFGACRVLGTRSLRALRWCWLLEVRSRYRPSARISGIV